MSQLLDLTDRLAKKHSSLNESKALQTEQEKHRDHTDYFTIFSLTLITTLLMAQPFLMCFLRPQD